MTTLGYIGLGAMGGTLAERLLARGHTVVGYNRTRSTAEWLTAHGLVWADSPAAVCRAADVTFVNVKDSAALEAVANGPAGFLAGLGPGKVIVDHSTVSPAVSRAVAARVREVGAEMVDAPVSGSPVTIRQNKLFVLVGGPAAVFERIKPLLLELGPKVIHMGDNGFALSMKIAHNLSLPIQMLAFAESVLLAEKSGISRELAVEVLTNSAMASPMLQFRGPFVLKLPDEPLFDVTMMQKDVLLALDIGRHLEVSLPMLAAANEFLNAARAAGLAKRDFAAVFQVLARMSNVEA